MVGRRRNRRRRGLVLTTYVMARQPLQAETAFNRFWGPLFDSSAPECCYAPAVSTYDCRRP
jgi:hypothetical protein